MDRIFIWQTMQQCSLIRRLFARGLQWGLLPGQASLKDRPDDPKSGVLLDDCAFTHWAADNRRSPSLARRLEKKAHANALLSCFIFAWSRLVGFVGGKTEGRERGSEGLGVVGEEERQRQ